MSIKKQIQSFGEQYMLLLVLDSDIGLLIDI